MCQMTFICIFIIIFKGEFRNEYQLIQSQVKSIASCIMTVVIKTDVGIILFKEQKTLGRTKYAKIPQKIK